MGMKPGLPHEGRTWAEGVLEQDAEEDMGTQDGERMRRMN
jgi:hypothetical protein